MKHANHGVDWTKGKVLKRLRVCMLKILPNQNLQQKYRLAWKT